MYKPKTAMVFAAGFGKRLRPRTETIPKPLIEVAGKSMLDRAIEALVDFGIRKIVINCHHLADQIKQRIVELQTRPNYPELVISFEPEILETAGGIINALPLLGNTPFFCVNSDVVWVDSDISTFDLLSQNYDPATMDSLLLLKQTHEAIGYDGNGDFNLQENLSLIKPQNGSASHVFTGIQILDPKILKNVACKPLSLFKDVIYPSHLKPNGSLKGIYGIDYPGTWLHIGTEDGLTKAEEKLANIP